VLSQLRVGKPVDPLSSGFLDFGHFYVGQDGILRPIGNRPAAWEGLPYGPIINRPQITNLPHTESAEYPNSRPSHNRRGL